MKHVFISIFILIIFHESYCQSDNGMGTPVDSSAKTSRCLASPFPSPPFPMPDWCGGPVIGEANGDSPDYLMKSIQKMTKKPWTKWNNTGILIYGWFDASINRSSSKYTNTPMTYDFIPNKPVLDQAILHIERPPDIEQTNHVSWGFLFDNIYGIDYRFTMAKGYLSDQLFKYNHIYGYDPTQFYGLLYVPHVGEGMLIKIGRFISPADIEAQWAPDNYLFSHSLMFGVDPYTFTGVNTTIRINKQMQFELGIHGGNDMSPWCNSSQVNGLAMFRWVSKDNLESLYGGINSIGAGQYKNGHDDLQMLVLVWGVKFSERVHMMTESYYIWQYNAALGGTAIYGPEEYGQGGGIGPIIPGLSKAYGFVNYFQILCSPKDYISIRNGALDDVNGSRTSFATWYTDHTIGWSHHFSDIFVIRPEIRYEQAWNNNNVTPYDAGTKKNQLSCATDLLINF